MKRVERAHRYCTLCNSVDIEDEYHFMIKCPVYDSIRKELIKPYYCRRPSVFKFVELMRSENKTILRNLSKFIVQAFDLRNSLINNIS